MSDADDFAPNAPELLEHNTAYAAGFAHRGFQASPLRRLAVVACMDSRIDTFAVLGLAHGEAHIIRNAGGVVTDDVIRSLCLSQRYLGTREIVLVHHTDCGLQRVTEDSFRAELEQELGVTPEWPVEAFTDPYADVRQSVERLRINPFVKHKDHISGYVFDVTTGRLEPVT